jgi:hypothetical protein
LFAESALNIKWLDQVAGIQWLERRLPREQNFLATHGTTL